jgi:hypothetical protein
VGACKELVNKYRIFLFEWNASALNGLKEADKSQEREPINANLRRGWRDLRNRI